MVAAAGTGLQQVTARIHQLGGGVTHGIGTGGRDLSEKIGAVTFRQGIDLLSRDPDVKVIVLVSKPPAPEVAEEVLQLGRNGRQARGGRPSSAGPLPVPPAAPSTSRPASTMPPRSPWRSQMSRSRRLRRSTWPDSRPGQCYLRGLFSGGTLAYEAQAILRDYLPGVWANAPLDKAWKLPNSLVSQEHSIVDLGEDEFTVGRLHPMLDNELRIRRLLQEAADPEVAVILLDVVLGLRLAPRSRG